MRALPLALGLVFMLALSLPPTTGYGQSGTEQRARDLFENGKRLYDEGLYDDAVAAWEAAYNLSPDKHLLLYNIANAYERLGRYQEALDNLNRYRALAPAEERETLERRMRNIERRLKEQQAATAEATPAPAPATNSNGTASLSVQNTSTSKPAPAGPNPGGLALVVGGGAGVAVGGVLGGLALQQRAQAQALCVESASGQTLCPTDAQPFIDQDRNLSLGGDIAMIAGGVALGAGLIVIIADAATGRGQTALRVLPSVGPGGAAVTFQGRF